MHPHTFVDMHLHYLHPTITTIKVGCTQLKKKRSGGTRRGVSVGEEDLPLLCFPRCTTRGTALGRLEPPKPSPHPYAFGCTQHGQMAVLPASAVNGPCSASLYNLMDQDLKVTLAMHKTQCTLTNPWAYCVILAPLGY